MSAGYPRIPTGPTTPGQLYTPDPAAVARLKALMAQERADRQTAEAARDAAAAALLAEAKRRKAEAKPIAPKATPAPAGDRTPTGRRRRSDKRLYSDDELASAYRAHQVEKQSWAQIARAMNTNRQALREALREGGYDLSQGNYRGQPSRVRNEQVRALYDRQMAGEQLVALAAEVGTDAHSLGRRFRALGLPSLRAQGRYQTHHTRADLEAAIAEHAAGDKWAVVAARRGITPQSLHGALLRHGLAEAKSRKE